MANRKQRIREMASMLRHAKAERELYMASRDLTFLRQSGEKTWCAFQLMLEASYHTEIKGVGDIERQIRKVGVKNKIEGKKLWDLYKNCFMCHKFFYEGQATANLILKTLKEDCWKTITEFRKKYNLY